MSLTVPDVLAEVGILPDRHGKALCPLHAEKTPSFTFTDELWHCFGCGAGGNAYQLALRLGVRKPRPQRYLEPGQRAIKGVQRSLLEPRGDRQGGPRPSEVLSRAVRSRVGARMAVSGDILAEATDWLDLGGDLYRVAPYRIDVREVAMDTVCQGLELEQRYRARHETDAAFVAFIQERRQWGVA